MSRSKGILIPGHSEQGPWLTVTSPLLPEWEALAPLLQDILERRWLTNQGHYARELEAALQAALGSAQVSLATNGTLALELLLRARLDGGEVIVPACSFPATWNLLFDDPRFTPVFVDIGPDNCLDPAAVAAAVTPRTTAVLGVHAYGAPCDRAALEGLASRQGLALLFDAAHAFGVQVEGAPLGDWGDGSAWSFHATKVFNTLEGGAVTTRHPELAAGVVTRRNFGLGPRGQESFGTNGKVDEFRAAVGLVTLPHVPAAIAARGRVAARYDATLADLADRGLVLPSALRRRPGFTPNHAYYPVLLEGPVTRDDLDAALRAHGVLSRQYFGEGLFRDPVYAGRVRPGALPRAAHVARSALCLPIHHAMTDADTDHVCGVVRAALGG